MASTTTTASIFTIPSASTVSTTTTSISSSTGIPNLKQPLLEHVATAVQSLLAVNLDHSVLDRMMVVPPQNKMGDMTLNCFHLLKATAAASPSASTSLPSTLTPVQMATQLAAVLAPLLTATATVSAQGPHVNFTYQPQMVATTILPHLSQQPLQLLRSTSGQGKTVVVDFSSPNIAKHLGFHHVRGTSIGHALSRIYAACGWQVTKINFVGDWGTAFGRLLSAWHRYNISLEQLHAADNAVTFLNNLYVQASKDCKAQPQLAEDARVCSKQLEDGHAPSVALWQLMCQVSLAEFKKVYALMDLTFDSWKGESCYIHSLQPLIDELKSRHLVTKDAGSLVVKLPGVDKPVLVQRADGGSLYTTRDLAAADDRYGTYHFDRALYVVDTGQSLHFQEWFGVARLLQRPYADNLRHVNYGIVLNYNTTNKTWQKVATRSGQTVNLLQTFEEAITHAAGIIADKNASKSAQDIRAIAEDVGVGAVVFNQLVNMRCNDIKYKLEDAVNTKGYTGPYIQYTHARLCSILRQGASACPQPGADACLRPGADACSQSNVDWSVLTRVEEKNVVLALLALPGALEAVTVNDEVSILCTAVLNVAVAVSSWLQLGDKDVSARVLTADVKLTQARLQLVDIVRAVVAESLHVLGLKAPSSM